MTAMLEKVAVVLLMMAVSAPAAVAAMPAARDAAALVLDPPFASLSPVVGALSQLLDVAVVAAAGSFAVPSVAAGLAIRVASVEYQHHQPPL